MTDNYWELRELRKQHQHLQAQHILLLKAVVCSLVGATIAIAAAIAMYAFKLHC